LLDSLLQETYIFKMSLSDIAVKASWAVVVSELVYRAYKLMKSKNERGKKEIMEVLFFPEDSTKVFNANQHLAQKYIQGGGVVINQNSNLARVLQYLRNAERSLDVCLYILSCPEFGNVVLECLRRGVTVRIIVDFVSIQENGLEVNRLRQFGVPVRGRKQEHHMHHKFVIVDSKVLLNGSFNWTQSAVTSNNENVMITSMHQFLTPFIQEFEKLWDHHKHQISVRVSPSSKKEINSSNKNIHSSDKNVGRRR